MTTTVAVRRAAAAAATALFLFNVLFAARAARAFLPRLRAMIDVSLVENGEGLRLAQHPRSGDPSYRMPIGSLTEAAAFNRLSPSAVSAWALLLYAVTVLLVFALARALGGDWAGLAAAAVWQNMFLDIPMSSGFYKQFWLTGLGLLGAVALVRHARKPRSATAAGVGAAFGLTVLARSVYFPFIPLLAAAEAARRRIRPALMIIVVAAAILLPWTAMNAVVKGRFQPIEYGAGNLNIVLGALGAVHGGEGDHVAFMGVPESERGRSPIGWAIRTVLARPVRFLRALTKRAAYMLGLHPWLFALAVIGVLAARRDEGTLALALQCAYFAAIVCAMPVEADYFQPLWPLLLALAATPLALIDAPPLPAAGAGAASVGVAAAAVLGGMIAARCEFAALSYAARFERRRPWSDAALDEAMARDPGDPWNSLEDARRRLRRHDPAGAVRVLTASGAAIGNLPRHRMLLAWARAKTGDLAPLLALRNPVAPESPAFDDDERIVLPVYQALALETSGRHREALARMGEAADENRGSAGFIHPNEEGPLAVLDPKLVARIDDSFAGYLQATLEEDEPDDLERALELAAEAHPTFSGWLALGREQAARGRKKEAVRALDRAETLAVDPEQLHQASFAWAEIGDGERSVLALERLTRRYPDRALFWSDLGVALFDRTDAAGAEKAFRRALKIEPGMGAATLSLAAIMESEGRDEDARRLCSEALELRPRDDGAAAMRAPLSACRDGRRD